MSRNFVFVGYSLSDPNFRAVLDDCRDVLGVQTFPLSYAIQRDFTGVQEAFWRGKYNIQLVKADATEFLVTLKDSWFAQECKVVPFLQRKSVEYLNFDTATRFQKVGDSFYLMRPSDCTGPSKPSGFFRGAEASWADIRDQVPPHRDAYDALFEGIFPEIAEPDVGASAHLAVGSAGTGKTALLHTLCYDLALAFGTPVFIHIAGTPLDARVLTPLINTKHPQRFVVLVDFAGEYVRELNLFWEELRHHKLPITLLLEERKNQWLVAKASMPMQLNPTEFELGTLSEGEISRILDALEKYGCLEKLKLTKMPREEQVAHFTALAHEDLLVALKELTTDTRFGKIVQNEFEKVPSPIARKAYLHVSSVSQFDLSVRYETLVRLLRLRYDQLGPEILLPTEGILITGEETGASRHNLSFRLRTRHPIIGSIVFGLGAPDDAAKFAVLNGLISNLDPAFPEDLRLLNEIIKRRELVGTFAEHAMRRALYDRIAAILPGNGYVFQFRSIIEREMDNADEAVRFARMALKIDPKHSHFQNTLGLALEFSARAEEGLKRQSLLGEADKLFEEGIKRDRSNPYPYIGKLNIIKQDIERAKTEEEKEEFGILALALLEEAYEATQESSMIAGELGKVKDQLGSLDTALDIVRRAERKNPADMRLKQLLIKFAVEKGEPKEALKVALDAAKADPTSWRIQRSIAQLLRSQNGNINSVRGHYEAAIRHHKGDGGLVVELGAYLFTKGAYEDANKVFGTLRDLSMSAQERNQIRDIWRDNNGKPQIFEGKVKRLAGARGTVVAIPDNFEASFWRSTGTSLLS